MSDFNCCMCGKCCKGDGSVFLYPQDVRNMAKEMEMNLQEFIDNYTHYIMLELVEDEGTFFYMPYLTLKKNSELECEFLKDNKCSIHMYKPFQCRTTPFMAEFFTDEEWRSQIREKCPGLRVMKDEDFVPYKKSHYDEAEHVEQEYLRELREHGFNLEYILDITLPAPDIIVCEDE